MIQTKGKTISKYGIKISALIIMFVLVFSIFPSQSDAGAPTSYAFGTYDSAGNVDLATGDMALSIPLFSVPQPGGPAYPIVLSYQAGIKLDQHASWVGLGWNLGVDSITRTMNNIPDDAYYTADIDNYFVYSKAPARYPTTNFNNQIKQIKLAQKRIMGRSVATSSSILGLAFAGFTELSNWVEGVANMDELVRQTKAYKNVLQLKDGGAGTVKVDGFMDATAAILDPDINNNIDIFSPDSYFVSSSAYSGPISFLRPVAGNDALSFVPNTYSGELWFNEKLCQVLLLIWVRIMVL